MGPIFLVVSITICILICTIYLGYIYRNSYISYQNNCIYSNYTKRLGGFTQTIYKSTYTMMHEPGNLNILWNEMNEKNRILSYCHNTSLHESLYTQQYSDSITVNRNLYINYSEQVQKLKKCLLTDDSILNEIYKLNILNCNINTITSSSSSLTISTDSTVDKYCSTIAPTCQIQEQCRSNTPKEILKQASFYATCDTLWLIHSFIYQCALTLLIFLCFNLSRFMFTRFLVEFFYSHMGYVFFIIIIIFFYIILLLSYLHRKTRFRVMTSCDIDGNYESFTKLQLQAQATILTKSLRSAAFLKLFITFLAHLPYIITIYLVDFRSPPR